MQPGRRNSASSSAYGAYSSVPGLGVQGQPCRRGRTMQTELRFQEFKAVPVTKTSAARATTAYTAVSSDRRNILTANRSASAEYTRPPCLKPTNCSAHNHTHTHITRKNSGRSNAARAFVHAKIGRKSTNRLSSSVKSNCPAPINMKCDTAPGRSRRHRKMPAREKVWLYRTSRIHR